MMLSHVCLQAAKPVLTLLNKFKSSNGKEDFSYITLQIDVNKLLKDFEESLYQASLSREKIRSAKYALCALIDEVIMLSNWREKLSWMSKTLQWQHFGEHSAGEGFFNALSELRQGGKDNVELLEWYYICLSLGFQGTYRMQSSESFSELVRDLSAQINRYNDYKPQQNTNHNLEGLSKLRWQKRNIILAVSGAFMLFYFILFCMINISASEFNLQVEKNHDAIRQLINNAGERS